MNQMDKENRKARYEEYYDLPHPEPKHHKRMSADARAAQFAPFAALTGFEEKIEKSAEDFNSQIR